MHRTIEKKVFWEFDSIIIQNMRNNLLLFRAPTWPFHHVIENHILLRFDSSTSFPGGRGESIPLSTVLRKSVRNTGKGTLEG